MTGIVLTLAAMLVLVFAPVSMVAATPNSERALDDIPLLA